MTPGCDPPVARASGFCSGLAITGCIAQETIMYDLFTSGLQIGTKRPELLLGNGDCTALIAVVLSTDF